MTVQATPVISKYVYSGPGSYAYYFRIFQEQEIIVTYYDAATNQPTVLARGTDYSVSPNAGYVGGEILTTYSPTDGRLEIRRQLELTQIEDLENADDFDQEALERGLDRLVMMVQEIDAVVAGTSITTNWKGNWATNTPYLIREIVAAPNGDWYVCVIPHTSDGASFSADLTRGYWSLTLKISDLELIRNDVEADRVEVETNKNIVASDKAIVSSDKDAVHADRIAVEALAGNIPDVSSASPGQILVVNSSKDGYDFGYPVPGKMPFGMEMEGTFIGGNYVNGTDAVNDIDVQPFVFPSHDNITPISSSAVITGATDASGANGMLGGAKQANDVLDIWALKGTSGVCIGFTRNGVETIGGVTLPSGYADTYKWIGTTGMLDGTDLASIVCAGNLFTYLDDTQAIFSGVLLGTAYTLKSLSGILPDDRYTACRFGAQDNDSAQVSFSIDGVNDFYTVDTSTSGMTSWGYRLAQSSGMIPIKDNQIYVKQNVSNTTVLLMQAATLRR